MSDRYRDLVNTPVGAAVGRRLGLPRPAVLRRHRPGALLLPGAALLTAGPGGSLAAVLERTLVGADVDCRRDDDGTQRFAAVVYDATGVSSVADLDHVRASLAPALRRLEASGRLLLLARPPGNDPTVAASRQAIDGLVRSVAKELRAGATANLVQVEDGAEAALESTLRFFLSGRSAFVSGQVVRVAPAEAPPPRDWDLPLEGRTAVVTGAAQGIGADVAATLARDGARVVCADLAAQGERLARVANRVGGVALQLDITDEAAASRLVDAAERLGGLDILVHNAGITRDRLLVNMTEQQWASVLAVNLEAQLRIDDWLLAHDVLGPGGRIVCAASTSGIAGNRGQSNYAASKAGIIGMVRAAAPEVAARGATINAVAPGFIETEMTARMPFATREVARRINSLQQGGQPVDVAETMAWLAQPPTAGVNGRVVRVCGQSLVGA